MAESLFTFTESYIDYGNTYVFRKVLNERFDFYLEIPLKHQVEEKQTLHKLRQASLKVFKDTLAQEDLLATLWASPHYKFSWQLENVCPGIAENKLTGGVQLWLYKNDKVSVQKEAEYQAGLIAIVLMRKGLDK